MPLLSIYTRASSLQTVNNPYKKLYNSLADISLKISILLPTFQSYFLLVFDSGVRKKRRSGESGQFFILMRVAVSTIEVIPNFQHAISYSSDIVQSA
jgi:hypothetical protein